MNETIAHYTVLEEGVADGIGRFLRARDTRVGRTVALRLFGNTDSDARRQFLHDARVGAGISHQNIAAIYDVDEWHGTPYAACEFVTGEPLRDAIGGRPMSPRRAVDLATQMADGLAELQAAGVIHGRLSVENAIVTPRGHVKLVDVTLARWSAPESARDRPSVEGDDMRALGAVLVEMVTGHPPVVGEVLRSGATRDLPDVVSAMVARLQAMRGAGASHQAAVIASELRAAAASIDARLDGDDEMSPATALEPRTSSFPWLVGSIVLAAIAVLIWLAIRASS